MEKFKNIIGIDYLKSSNLNDAKIELASKKDRNDRSWKGLIGLNTFRFIMNDHRFEGKSLILEMIDDSILKQEIELLYTFIK